MDISSASQALELSRQKIDEDIQHGYEVVRKLKTRRNTFAYISRLPTEIISRIFVILTYSGLNHSDCLSRILSVTAVCGHWRAIALECPNLWTFVDFSSLKWVEEMLKRSKMAPLIIKADNLYDETSNRVDAIRLSLQHISRIKELRLAASKHTIANLIDPIDKPAPLLQSLHLHDSHYRFGDDTYTLPKTLFVCGGRRLHRLELVDCSIPWESPLLCGLVHLKFAKSFGEAKITATQLVDVLEKMPLLETLDLEGLLPVPSGDTKRVVHLSHLTSLRLSCTVPGGVYILKLISFPASTSLVLFCRFTSRIDYSTVFDAVSSVWNGEEGSQLLRCLEIDCITQRSRRLWGWTTSNGTDRKSSGPSQIEIELLWPFYQDTENNAIINLCNALTLTDLSTLFIHEANVPTATWLRAFGHLTSLQTLHFTGMHAFKLVSALSRRLNDTGEVFLSGLHDLWLEDIDFAGTDHKPFFEELRDCLMTRCHWNAELHGLHLRDCYALLSEGVDLLREIVVDVDWDGVEAGIEDERQFQCSESGANEGVGV